jgi:hypothetical protein
MHWQIPYKCWLILWQVKNRKLLHPRSPLHPQKPQKPDLTLVDVRTVLGEKANAGFSEDVRNLLHKYGASKLSAVSPEQYPALLKDAEAIGHATE